ncbi:glycoside hydrolase family 3 protein [Kribbella sp.]|uniref:glycoside hydrolase family 3 protein n=1 Tax=Kribbella sp. TaxID=1871183 RepID=UPI002D59338D|nr:glycoside hydrolase family 3 C-terminal domain-containing protein [Kribbella sp.]HZX05278.1 glycoside hydrolase family 3 C-terminal domain-containing protein [Kribbella sp.]
MNFDDLLGRLSLEEKVRILTGQDFWSTHALPSIGLRSMVLSDGPSGVRGPVWDERDPSLNLPSATALSSSWDVGIAHRYGVVSALEARRKNVDVVLGPTINLHRSPLGGRHFEAFSEDPVLTADLAAAYVAGVQELGVGATPKHYVANDFETDRFTANVEVDERTLREVYLLAFEKAVTESKAWLVMSAYNSINGATASENELLETPLNTDWGFDGVVVSDWTAVRSIESAKHSQDLAMPGPIGAWGDALLAAVRSGEVKEDAIDRKVRRILALAARVGALEGTGKPTDVPQVDGVAFARTAAAEGTVLLRNEGALPWENVQKVAVIGHNAREARTQGGGSATVIPKKVVSPLDGLRAALPGVEVSYSIGAVVQEGVADLPLGTMTNPENGEHGARVRFLGADGAELFAEDRFSSALVYLGGNAPIGESAVFEFRTTWTPAESGAVRLGFASVGHGRIFADGKLLREDTAVPVGNDLGAALLSPPSISTPLDVTAGQPVDVRVELDLPKVEGGLSNALSITVGVEPADDDPQALIDEAVAAARDADVALVVVGTNSKVESEGYDRTSLALPGRQDDLVRAVAAANPRTVVVVNAGSPVLLPWRNNVAAVLATYFGGQEYGDALADVLLGRTEPGGRLPTTWPREQADVPVIDVTPENGVVRYDEGIHIGYRAWLKAGTEPAYEFGHGLGYTTWELSDLRANDPSSVALTVRNTGDRAGKQVVQVYVERPDSAIDRPVRWLAGFAVVRLDAGQAREITIHLHQHTFEHWAVSGNEAQWSTEPGAFTIRAGSSVSDLPLSTELQVR